MTAINDLAPNSTSKYHPAEQLSLTERLAIGKALRQKIKCSDQGTYEPPINREDPIALLEAQAKTRLTG
jgi:hypothetical protein